jgi:hypothetical protein
MDEPLSNIDLNKYIKQVENKGVNIFQMDNLKPNTQIEHIFKDRGHVIYFVKYPDSNIGHWICNLRTPDGNIYWMDSFGDAPNEYNKNVIPCYKNNNIKHLNISEAKLQGGKSMACGKYATLFVTLHKMGIEPTQMIDFLKSEGKKYGSVDKFILSLFG